MELSEDEKQLQKGERFETGEQTGREIKEVMEETNKSARQSKNNHDSANVIGTGSQMAKTEEPNLNAEGDQTLKDERIIDHYVEVISNEQASIKEIPQSIEEEMKGAQKVEEGEIKVDKFFYVESSELVVSIHEETGGQNKVSSAHTPDLTAKSLNVDVETVTDADTKDEEKGPEAMRPSEEIRNKKGQKDKVICDSIEDASFTTIAESPGIQNDEESALDIGDGSKDKLEGSSVTLAKYRACQQEDRTEVEKKTKDTSSTEHEEKNEDTIELNKQEKDVTPVEGETQNKNSLDTPFVRQETCLQEVDNSEIFKVDPKIGLENIALESKNEVKNETEIFEKSAQTDSSASENGKSIENNDKKPDASSMTREEGMQSKDEDVDRAEASAWDKRDKEGFTVIVAEDNIRKTELVEAIEHSKLASTEHEGGPEHSLLQQNKPEEKLERPLNVISEEIETAASRENAEFENPEDSLKEKRKDDKLTAAYDINGDEIPGQKNLPLIGLNEKTESAEAEIPNNNAKDIHVRHSLVEETGQVEGKRIDDVLEFESEEQIQKSNGTSMDEKNQVTNVSEAYKRTESTVLEHSSTEGTVRMEMIEKTSENTEELETVYRLVSEEKLVVKDAEVNIPEVTKEEAIDTEIHKIPTKSNDTEDGLLEDDTTKVYSIVHTGDEIVKQSFQVESPEEAATKSSGEDERNNTTVEEVHDGHEIRGSGDVNKEQIVEANVTFVTPKPIEKEATKNHQENENETKKSREEDGSLEIIKEGNVDDLSQESIGGGPIQNFEDDKKESKKSKGEIFDEPQIDSAKACENIAPETIHDMESPEKIPGASLVKQEEGLQGEAEYLAPTEASEKDGDQNASSEQVAEDNDDNNRLAEATENSAKVTPQGEEDSEQGLQIDEPGESIVVESPENILRTSLVKQEEGLQGEGENLDSTESSIENRNEETSSTKVAVDNDEYNRPAETTENSAKVIQQGEEDTEYVLQNDAPGETNHEVESPGEILDTVKQGDGLQGDADNLVPPEASIEKRDELTSSVKVSGDNNANNRLAEATENNAKATPEGEEDSERALQKDETGESIALETNHGVESPKNIPDPALVKQEGLQAEFEKLAPTEAEIEKRDEDTSYVKVTEDNNANNELAEATENSTKIPPEGGEDSDKLLLTDEPRQSIVGLTNHNVESPENNLDTPLVKQEEGIQGEGDNLGQTKTSVKVAEDYNDNIGLVETTENSVKVIPKGEEDSEHVLQKEDPREQPIRERNRDVESPEEIPDKSLVNQEEDLQVEGENLAPTEASMDNKDEDTPVKMAEHKANNNEQDEARENGLKGTPKVKDSEHCLQKDALKEIIACEAAHEFESPEKIPHTLLVKQEEVLQGEGENLIPKQASIEKRDEDTSYMKIAEGNDNDDTDGLAEAADNSVKITAKGEEDLEQVFQKDEPGEQLEELLDVMSEEKEAESLREKTKKTTFMKEEGIIQNLKETLEVEKKKETKTIDDKKEKEAAIEKVFNTTSFGEGTGEHILEEIDSVRDPSPEFNEKETIKENSKEDQECRGLETAASSTNIEKSNLEKPAIAELSSSLDGEVTVKESLKEEESDATKLNKEVEGTNLEFIKQTEATDLTEESKSETLQDCAESNKDFTALTTIENYFFMPEASVEEIKEEILKQEENTIIDSDPASAAVASEAGLKEAEPDNKEHVKSSDIAPEGKGLATIETGGVSLDTVDIDVQSEENSKLEESRNKEILTVADEAGEKIEHQLEDKAPSRGNDNELALTTEETTLDSISEDGSRDSYILPLQEEPMTTAVSKIVEETPTRDEITDENAKTPSSVQKTDKKLIQMEDESIKPKGVSEFLSSDVGKEGAIEEVQKDEDAELLMPPELDNENNSYDTKDVELSKRGETSDLADQTEVCKLETLEDENPSNEASKPISVSTYRGSEKAILELEDPVQTQGSLTGVPVEKGTADVKAGACSHECEPTNTKKDELLAEKNLESADLGQKVVFVSDTVTKDQSDDTLLQTNKSQTEENSNDIQDWNSKSVEPQITGQVQGETERKMAMDTKLEAEDHINVSQTAKETITTVIATEEVHEIIEEVDGSESIKEQAIHGERDLKEIHKVSAGDEILKKVEDCGIESSEYLKATNSNEQTETINADIEEEPTRETEASSTKAPEEENIQDEFSLKPADVSMTVAEDAEEKIKEKIKVEVDNFLDEHDNATVVPAESRTGEAHMDDKPVKDTSSDESLETITTEPCPQAEEVGSKKLEKTSSSLASQLPNMDRENVDKESVTLEKPDADEVEETKTVSDAVFGSKYHGVEETHETGQSLRVEKLDSDRTEEGNKEDSKTVSESKSLGIETVIEDEMTADQTLSAGNSEEQLQTPSSELMSLEQEHGPTSVVKETEAIKTMEVEMLDDKNIDDSSATKATEEACLQKEEQLQTISSALLSREQEHGATTAFKKEEEESTKEVETLDDKNINNSSAIKATEETCLEQEEPMDHEHVEKESVTLEKPNADEIEETKTVSDAVFGSKYHGVEETHETGQSLRVEKLDSDRTKEGNKDDSKTASESESLGIETVIEDEMTADQTLSAGNLEEQLQTPSSELLSLEQKHGPTTVVKETEAIKTIEAEMLDDKNIDDSSATKATEEMCLKKEEQLQTLSSALLSGEQEHGATTTLKMTEEESTKEVETLDDKSSAIKATEKTNLEQEEPRELEVSKLGLEINKDIQMDSSNKLHEEEYYNLDGASKLETEESEERTYSHTLSESEKIRELTRPIEEASNLRCEINEKAIESKLDVHGQEVLLNSEEKIQDEGIVKLVDVPITVAEESFENIEEEIKAEVDNSCDKTENATADVETTESSSGESPPNEMSTKDTSSDERRLETIITESHTLAEEVASKKLENTSSNIPSQLPNIVNKNAEKGSESLASLESPDPHEAEETKRASGAGFESKYQTDETGQSLTVEKQDAADVKDTKETAETSSNYKALGVEADSKDEVIADQTLPAGKLGEQLQTPSSSFPSREQEHGTTTTVERTEEEEMKEVKTIGDESIDHSSAAKTAEVACLKMKELRELEVSTLGLESSKATHRDSSNEVQKEEGGNLYQASKLETHDKEEIKYIDSPSEFEGITGLTRPNDKASNLNSEISEKAFDHASEVESHQILTKSEDINEKHLEAAMTDLNTEESKETVGANQILKDQVSIEEVMEDKDVAKDSKSVSLGEETILESHKEDESKAEEYPAEETNKTFKATRNANQQEALRFSEIIDKGSASENIEKNITAEDRTVEHENAAESYPDEAEGKNVEEASIKLDLENKSDETNFTEGKTEVITLREKEAGEEISQKEGTTGLSEINEITQNIQQLEKTSYAASNIKIPGEADPSENKEAMIATGHEDVLPVPQHPVDEALQKVELEHKIPGKAMEVDAEKKGVECEGEKRMGDSGEINKESASVDSTNISLSDLLQRSMKENLQAAKDLTKEREPMPSKEEMQNEEAETTQIDEAKTNEEEGDEHKRSEPDSDALVMVEASKDTDVKVPHKKSHNILSGVGSKVKHSISKVKKAITGKSSHPKTSSPK